MGIEIQDDRYLNLSLEALEVGATRLQMSEVAAFAGGRSIIRIYCDELVIDQPLIAPGADVTIVARLLVNDLDNDASGHVNVSGLPGTSFLPEQRPPPAPIGSDGGPGKDGDSGRPAGRITMAIGAVDKSARVATPGITLLATGGGGGRAQDGQKGGEGLASPDYTESEAGIADDNALDKPPLAGPQGQPGRTGGPAGISGRGGDGGVIRIAAVRLPPLRHDVEGGREGAFAENGDPGEGGLGGRGTRALRCRMQGNRHTDRYMSCQYYGDWPVGGRGDRGPLQAHVPRSLGPGAKGVFAEVPLTELQGLASVRYLRLQMTFAERHLLKGDALAAGKILAWILLVGDGEQHAVVTQRAAALLRDMARGTPYGGMMLCETPSLSYEAYGELLDKLLESTSRVRNVLDSLKHEAKFSGDIRTQFEALAQVGEHLQASVEDKTKAALERAGELYDNLLGLDSALSQIWADVIRADADFQREVSAKAKCGEYIAIAATIAQVVVLAGSTGAGVLKAYTGYQEVKKWLADSEEEKKKIEAVIKEADDAQKGFVKVKEGAQEFSKTVDQFSKFVGALEVGPPDDTVKLWMSEEEFDAMIAPYRELASARRLTALMSHFFSLVNKRNIIVLEHAAAVQQVSTLKAALALHRERTDEFLAINADHLLDRAEAIYERAAWIDIASRGQMLLVLSEAFRALDYWTLSKSTVSIGDADVVGLEAAYQTFLRSVADAKNRFAQPPVHFPASSTPMRVVFRRADFAQQFAEFEETNVMYLAVAPHLATGIDRIRWNVRVDSIAVALHGTHAENFDVKLIHMGDSEIRDASGVSHLFSHKPVVTAVTVAPNTPADLSAKPHNLGKSSDYAQVSPYATWRVEALEVDLRSANITEVELVFGGICHHQTWFEALQERGTMNVELVLAHLDEFERLA